MTQTDSLRAELDALVIRHCDVPVEVWEHLFEHALEDHHPDAYHFEGDDGDVIGQIIAAEGDEEIAPALELNDLTWLRELELEQQPST